jgi:hypothetical protein
MKCYSRMFFLAILALAAVSFTGAMTHRAYAAEQQAKAAPAAQESDETPYDDVEYNAYMAASQEPDLAKRGPMLLEFIKKYPKSALMANVNSDYMRLMKEASGAKKYELLMTLADKWLELHPGDVVTIGYQAEASNNLGDFDKCAECMEEIYKKQASPTLARDIFQVYQKTKNLAKQIDWANILFKMPEYDADYALRSYFVQKYAEAKNTPKAAEYAQLTLKSADAVKQPNAQTQEELRKVRYASYLVIATDLMEKDKYADAIPALQKANKYERSGEIYRMIGQCQENLKLVDEAIVTYAKAELVAQEKGETETASKAKARLEQLYKAIHNNTIIGIEKIYRKAKEELAAEK